VDLLWDGVFYRTEGLDQPTPWHQDAPYWPVQGDKIVSVWMPLDPAPERSVLGFVRGSHRMGTSNGHRSVTAANHLISRLATERTRFRCRILTPARLALTSSAKP
jgi:ectoine hydroxylase-related dioxygenase (phytanoyl-CoA dioxygenase family)